MSQHLEADVIVVGGGPAGLAAAIECKRLGIKDVVVIEREAEAGGIPRHCGHPPFGMREFHRVLTGPAYARRLVQAALAAGVAICVRHHVVALEPHGMLRLTCPAGLKTARARRVILATGVRETPRSARLVSGTRPIGVMNTGALQSHLYLKGLKPFEAPIIVGTELVALSAVLSCLKAGIRPVAVIESNARPTARWPLALFPSLCGVPIRYENTLLEIHGEPRVQSVTVGHRDGTQSQITCDGVLLTGVFLPEASLIKASHLQFDALSGGPAIDQEGRTSDPSYYAAGNLLRPVETAGWSFREGRRIGRIVASSLLADESAVSMPASLPVTVGSGLKYAVPSKISVSPGRALGDFQLRVSAAIQGHLLLKIDDRMVWRKRISALPERRILVPIPSISPESRSIWIGFEDRP